jgi:formylmethanofuran dehydrogenase subunit E
MGYTQEELAARRKEYKRKAREKNKLKPKEYASKPVHEDNPEYVKAMRMCLGPSCGKMFMSEWKGNRLCKSCAPRAKNTSPFEPDFGTGSHKVSSPHHK